MLRSLLLLLRLVLGFDSVCLQLNKYHVIYGHKACFIFFNNVC